MHPTYSAHLVWPDGSTEDIKEAIDDRPLGLRVMKDLDKKTKIVADPATSLKSTYALSSAEVESARSKENCSGLPSAGSLLGYPVVLETETIDRGDQRTITIRKLAPSLNCFSLSDYSRLEELSGNTLASASKTVTQVILAVPSRSDLASADDFAERKPSELMAALDQVTARTCSACKHASASRLDLTYLGLQRAAQP